MGAHLQHGVCALHDDDSHDNGAADALCVSVAAAATIQSGLRDIGTCEVSEFPPKFLYKINNFRRSSLVPKRSCLTISVRQPMIGPEVPQHPLIFVRDFIRSSRDNLNLRMTLTFDFTRSSSYFV